MMKQRQETMKKRIVFDALLFFALTLVAILAGFLLLPRDENKKSELSERGLMNRGLPVIEIQLRNTSLETIESGDKNVIYSGNNLDLYQDGDRFQYNNVEIKGRGNWTWGQIKKPYRIKFDKKVDLLGMGKARKWCLLANYSDGTNLRNEIAFDLAKMLGMEYVMNGRYVELYIDGDYRGLYYLTHVVEIGKNIVNLRDPLGVLMELDNLYSVDDEKYSTNNDDILMVKDVVDKDHTIEAVNDFMNSYNELEIAIHNKQYDRIVELADVRSFAQYYLLSEFTVNPDSYVTSFYFYKDGPNDKIHAGPGWDFDLAFRNHEWTNWLGEKFYSPTETMVRKLEFSSEIWTEMGHREEEYMANDALSRIMFELMEIPEFQEEVLRVFREQMSGREEQLVNRIVLLVNKIYPAAKEDAKKWGKENSGTEILEIMQWIKTRYKYFEEIYGDNKKVVD